MYKHHLVIKLGFFQNFQVMSIKHVKITCTYKTYIDRLHARSIQYPNVSTSDLFRIIAHSQKISPYTDTYIVLHNTLLVSRQHQTKHLVKQTGSHLRLQFLSAKNPIGPINFILIKGVLFLLSYAKSSLVGLQQAMPC